MKLEKQIKFTFILLVTILAMVNLEPKITSAATNNKIVTIADKFQFSDTKSPSFLYGRGLVTTHTDKRHYGRLYATSEHYVKGVPSYLIFESVDNGNTWNKISEVQEQHNFTDNQPWGTRYQPFLYELPEKVGKMPAGTIICIGNSIPGDLSQTSIDLYYSKDHAQHWKYLSTVAKGGHADINTKHNGPVWEPFLKVINHQLVCFYSDERDKPKYSQKLVHQVSNDGIYWGEKIDDVAFKSPNARPGMVTIAQMANQKYIMTYEVVNAGEWRTNYKISNDGLNWDAGSEGNRLAYGGAPYVVTMNDGTIVANTDGSDYLYINRDNLKSGQWQIVKCPMPLAYSRSITVLPNNQLLFVSGGPLKAPTATDDNQLTSMIFNLK